jgi:hypothetical protein
MSRRRITHPIFVAVDAWGIPLELCITVATKHGWTPNQALLDFMLGALDAGWSRTKVASDLRELTMFMEIDARLQAWASGR